MLEVSRAPKKKKSVINFYLVGIILFFVLIGSFVFANNKLKQFDKVNNDLTKQMEQLKVQEQKLKEENNILKQSKSDLDNKLNNLSNISN